MTIGVVCPSCRQRLQAPESAVGQKTECPSCGTRFVVLSESNSSPHATPQPNPSAAERQETPAEESPSDALTPEILAWARQQLNEEETVAGLREIRETGGLELADFLHDLQREAIPRE